MRNKSDGSILTDKSGKKINLVLDLSVFIILLILLILIGIKFGVEVLAIILSILAIIPIVMSFYYYFRKCPIIHYRIASKRVENDDEGYIYRYLLDFHSKRGDYLIESFYIIPEYGVIPKTDYKGAAIFELCYGLRETREKGFAPTLKLSMPEIPIYQTLDQGLILRFCAEEEKNKFKIKMVMDISLDPMKQGIHSIFHGIFRYRLFSEMLLDFDTKEDQRGSFKKFYF